MTKTTALFTYNPDFIPPTTEIENKCFAPWVRANGSRVEVIENPECDNERSAVRDSYYDDYAVYAVIFPGEPEPKYYVFNSELSDFVEEEVCHCGEPIYTEPDGFCRGLCETCHLERCDAPVEDVSYTCHLLRFVATTKLPF